METYMITNSKESLFNTKTKYIHRINLNNFKEAIQIIDKHIDFHNNQRIQLKTKLTPIEFRCQFAA